ncbi:MAG TPA: DUF2330 domain-containing protein [Candidatus Baltobacteraceae bacterium]|nr:DUF2330 domain-containing protein [Candidatus Baltobacteraceae bacterium]
MAAIVGSLLLGASTAAADGCFVFHWNKQKDINEPTQKAIILYDQGQEDMVLQVKYEGPAEEFGWLIPVPGLPEVSNGSMDCFYELSEMTQRQFDGRGSRGWGRGRSASADAGVNVIKIETVGAYEVAVLSASTGENLKGWLDAHHFAFPNEKQKVLDGYIRKHWYFVAAKIDPTQDGFILRNGPPKTEPESHGISPVTRKQLSNGELHPLVLRFPSEKCVFPLAISAVNGKPSEVSLYVLSSEPLINRGIFEERFAGYCRRLEDWMQGAGEREKQQGEAQRHQEDVLKRMAERRNQREAEIKRRVPAPEFWDDPSDPRPSEADVQQLMKKVEPRRITRTESEDYTVVGSNLAQSMVIDSRYTPACVREMPRLEGKAWWLTKLVEVFEPENMRDLEFEPAVPIFAEKLGKVGGQAPALCLSEIGAVPAVLSALNSTNPIERRQAALAASGHNSPSGAMEDARLAAAVPGLLADADPRNRRDGCCAAGANWDPAFGPRVAELLGDSDDEVSSAASQCLWGHVERSLFPVYRKMIMEDLPGASKAIHLTWEDFTREQLVHCLASTNQDVVEFAFGKLRYKNLTLNEIEPLLTNSLASARMMGLGALDQIGNKDAVDRIFAMLYDPNEGVRWNVRAGLRRLTGQKLGPDPAAWEKWWAENNKDFTPPMEGSQARYR